MEKPYFQNDFAEFWIEDSILYFVYKPGSRINLQAAKRIVEDRVNLQNGVAYPVFCDMRNVMDSDKSARDYLAKEGSNLVKAVAVMIDSPITKMMLNFYLAVNKPITPTRLFTDKNQALEYLNSYSLRVSSE